MYRLIEKKENADDFLNISSKCVFPEVMTGLKQYLQTDAPSTWYDRGPVVLEILLTLTSCSASWH